MLLQKQVDRKKFNLKKQRLFKLIYYFAGANLRQNFKYKLGLINSIN